MGGPAAGRLRLTGMSGGFDVAAAAGSLRATVRPDATFPHAWTTEGVAVEMQFTGAHLLHLSAAACVLNDLYREAHELQVPLDGVRVTAAGDFDRSTWQSTGITYAVEVDTAAAPEQVDALLQRVDEVAEIPQALRQSTVVRRAGT